MIQSIAAYDNVVNHLTLIFIAVGTLTDQLFLHFIEHRDIITT